MIKFWDLEIIKDNILSKPSLITIQWHKCNCEYCCHNDDDDEYKCSECKYIWYVEKFNYDKYTWFYKCPKCKTKLESESDLELEASRVEKKYKPL